MSKKVVLSIIGLLFLVIGAVAGVYLVQQQQLVQKKASVPGGIASIHLDPTTLNSLNVGDEFDAGIYINSGGVAISAITAQLEYTYEGTDGPPIEATDIIPNPQLAQDQDAQWSFPVKSITDSGDGQVRLRLAAITTSPTGFSASSDVMIGTVHFRVQRAGQIVVSFDETQSKITLKATAEDQLATPTSTGTYATSTSAPSPTPTPPTDTADPTPTVTSAPGSPTNTPAPTNTPSPTSAATPTPTSAASGSDSSDTGIRSVVITNPQNGATLTDTTPTFSGTASNYATINFEVHSSDVVTGSTGASSTGAWSWTVPTPLSGGDHTATITATDQNGGITTATVNFTISTATGTSDLPVAGTSLPTLIMLVTGLFLISGAVILKRQSF